MVKVFASPSSLKVAITINCPQCHNPQTHDVNGGHEVDTDDLLSQICENPLLNGVTFSGGEPFLQAKPLAQLAKEVHKRGLNITTFTGYTLEQLQNMHNPDIDELLNQTDVLIDGPFLIEKKDLTLQLINSLELADSVSQAKPPSTRFTLSPAVSV